jgi:putative phosphoribosyl transferase
VRAVPQPRRFEVLDIDLDGAVVVPEGATGMVLFAHGLGGTQHDERDVLAARELNNVGLATVMVDLLTPAEQRIDAATAEFRFDAGFLAVRVIALVDVLATEHDTAGLPGGILGSHSGAAAALIAAAARPQWVRGVAARGGRPDLAGEFLQLVRAPTLLVVGEYDHPLREVNEEAADRIRGLTRVAVVPNAGHLFEEPGTAAQAAELTRDWFRVLLRPREQAHSR